MDYENILDFMVNGFEHDHDDYNRRYLIAEFQSDLKELDLVY